MNIGRQSINRERNRQIAVEGYSAQHDDQHKGGELFLGAECYHFAGDLGRYILSDEVPQGVIPPPKHWPFEATAWKPGSTPRRNYEKAGAMYLAELHRYERAGNADIEFAENSRQNLRMCEEKINLSLSVFVRAFADKTEVAYQNSVNKGFHENDINSNEENGNRLMLMVSEIAEAHDALRHGNPPDDHIPDFSGAEAELADVVIRAMDVAETNGWRLAEAIEAKMIYNANRPYKHGKKF